MLIVEGPDGSGKTTLIGELREVLNLPVAPRVVSKNTEAMLDLRDWVDNNLEEGFQRVIFDRYRLISESIYGPVIRDMQHPGFDDQEWLMSRLVKFYNIHPIIIYCLPPLQTVIDNVTDDEDNQMVQPRIRSIYNAYVNRATLDFIMSPAPTFIFDYTKGLTSEEKQAWFETIHTMMTREVAA